MSDLQFFAYQHLPEHLQKASKPFFELAETIVRDYPDNPEREMALRKLLEAKDCAVRARLYKMGDEAKAFSQRVIDVVRDAQTRALL